MSVNDAWYLVSFIFGLMSGLAVIKGFDHHR